MSTLFLFPFFSYCQNQAKADSLIDLWRSNEVPTDLTLRVFHDIALYTNDPSIKIDYSRLLIEASSKADSNEMLYQGYLMLGSGYTLKGKINQALQVLFEGAELANTAKDIKNLGAFYGQISSVYGLNKDQRNALIYKKKALKEFEKVGDEQYIGYGSLNIGNEYYKLGEYDSALYYTSKSLPIFAKQNFTLGIAYVKGNTAQILWKMGEIEPAIIGLQDAISKLRPLRDYYGMADYLNSLGEIYLEQNRLVEAIQIFEESYTMASNVDLKEQLRDASLKLSLLYEKADDFSKAYDFHKQYSALKDSIQSIETTQKMADLRTEFEVGQKQAEVDLLTAEKRTQRIITIAVGAFAFILVVLAAIIYKYYRSKAKINTILAKQKEELERLNSTKDKFFSIISHDLRSPVAGFHGISQMIKMMVKTKQTDQLLEMTGHIDSSVDQLSKLLDNLLNWAMQQQGHIPNVPEKLNLKEMAEELFKVLSNMAQGKSIDLVADVPDKFELWSDKNTTMTILRNLVNNALKFTPEGGKVGIRASEQDGMARIEVYDTGVGIPKDKLKKLFQLQDKKSTYGTSGEKGLGLGLQLVHEFMEMNNGRIDVASEEGKGTTFTLWLPLFEAVGEVVEK